MTRAARPAPGASTRVAAGVAVAALLGSGSPCAGSCPRRRAVSCLPVRWSATRTSRATGRARRRRRSTPVRNGVARQRARAAGAGPRGRASSSGESEQPRGARRPAGSAPENASPTRLTHTPRKKKTASVERTPRRVAVLEEQRDRRPGDRRGGAGDPGGEAGAHHGVRRLTGTSTVCQRQQRRRRSTITADGDRDRPVAEGRAPARRRAACPTDPRRQRPGDGAASRRGAAPPASDERRRRAAPNHSGSAGHQQAEPEPDRRTQAPERAAPTSATTPEAPTTAWTKAPTRTGQRDHGRSRRRSGSTTGPRIRPCAGCAGRTA